MNASKLSRQTRWQRLARRTAGKVNAAWCLDKLALPLVLTTLAGACLILVARRELESFPRAEALTAGAIALCGLAAVAWWLARRHFESANDALVRIEASMKLHNALSAARCGVTPWPELPERVDDGTRWRWTRLVAPLGAAVLFLGGSFLLPVTAKSDADAPPPGEPQAWRDLETDLETLDRGGTVEQQYLREMNERLEELRRQPPNEWFSHSSLEATDALERMHHVEVEDLAQNLRQAERTLRALQKHGAQLGEGTRQRLLDEFMQAVENMGEGKIKPNQELLEQLGKIDPGKLRQLDQNQLDQLRESMQQHARNCQGAGSPGQTDGQGGEDWLDELLSQGSEPNPDGQGGPGTPDPRGSGQGDVTRGPGTAPGVLGAEGGDVQTGEFEGLEARDLSRSLPGDLLELQDGEHEVDQTGVGIRAGGRVAGQAAGGDRIWKDALLPSEKMALREFFK